MPTPLAKCLLVATLLAVAIHSASAIFASCPSRNEWDACFRVYDTNHDNYLQLAEFETAWKEMSWFVKAPLNTPKHYFVRCDANDDDEIDGREMQTSTCFSSCEQQSAVFTSMCT